MVTPVVGCRFTGRLKPIGPIPPVRLLETIRRPEYTGENRCWPCTVVNVVLVGLATVAVALFSPLVAFVLALGGSGAILLRGYAVPYTPRFAPKLVERLPSSWNPFQAERVGPRESDSLATDDVDPEALLGALIEADVIAAEGERLTLEKRFRERWREEMRTLRERSDEELAAAARDASAATSAAETVEVAIASIRSRVTDGSLAVSSLTGLAPFEHRDRLHRTASPKTGTSRLSAGTP